MVHDSTVREELEKILGSPVFVNSPRMSRFLRFVVDQTLQGSGAGIKEYVIAASAMVTGWAADSV